MVKVYTQMPFKTYMEGQRNQVICLLGFAMYVAIVLSVLSFVPTPISWMFNNLLWFLVVPLIPTGIFVGLTIRWANRRYGWKKQNGMRTRERKMQKHLIIEFENKKPIPDIVKENEKYYGLDETLAWAIVLQRVRQT